MADFEAGREPGAAPVSDAPGARARPASATLAERLRDQPHEYAFFAAMRLLEAAHRGRPRFGHSKRPAQDALRLAQEPSVTHAPAMLAGYEPGADGRPDRLLVHFLGLFGPDGPLPLHLTEYASNRRRNHGDATFQRFADLFLQKQIAAQA